MSILVCIRQMPYSEKTVRFAGLIAGLEEHPITLMTVIDNENVRSEAESGLISAIDLLKDMKVSTKIRQGAVLEQVLVEAGETDYRIIIVGAHIAAGLLDALFGSLTEKIADKAQSSVFVVKSDRPAEINKILVAIGGVKMNQRVVTEGARLARETNADVRVLFVTNPIPTMYTGLGEIEETLPELLQTDTPVAQHLRWSARYLADQEVEAEVEVVQGVAAEEILREAHQGDYDVIVLGQATTVGPLRRILTDQVTPHVVERAPCSVYVIH